MQKRQKQLFYTFLGLVLSLLIIHKAAMLGQAQEGGNSTSEYQGQVVPKEVFEVYPDTAGYITEVLVVPGDEVKAGDPLMKLDPVDAELNIEVAEAQLREATLTLQYMKQPKRSEEVLAAQQSLDNARNSLNSFLYLDENEKTVAVAGLNETRAGVQLAQFAYDKFSFDNRVALTPLADALMKATIGYEAAQSAYNLRLNPQSFQMQGYQRDLTLAELALALAGDPYTESEENIQQAMIEQRQVALVQAQQNLADTILRAPAAGIVSAVDVSPGGMAYFSGLPGTRILRMVSKEMAIEIQVNEQELSQFPSGQEVVVRVSAYPGQEFPAVVDQILPKNPSRDTTVAATNQLLKQVGMPPIPDSSTLQTFTVRFTVQDEKGLLRSGMSAEVSFDKEKI